MNEFTFVFNLEPYSHKGHDGILEKDSQRMSIIMCKSLREAGISSPILAISSNGNMPDENTLSQLKNLGVDFSNEVIKEYPFNGYFNKIYGYGFLSKKITTPYVCFLDIDIIFLKSDFFDRIKNLLETYDVISAMGFDPKLPKNLDNPLKSIIYTLIGILNKEDKDYLELTYGLSESNWIPSGVLFFKNSSSLQILMEKWKDISEVMLKDQNIAKFFSTSILSSQEGFDGIKFSDEESLSIAMKDLNVLISPVEELLHYHLFSNLFKVVEENKEVMPEYMSTLLEITN